MPTIADYVVVPGTDSPITLPVPQAYDFHSSEFAAPGVNLRSPSVLFWMVKPEGSVRVQVNLNGQVVRVVLFNSTPQRAWHEVIQAGLLQAQGNTVDLAVVADDNGDIGNATVSDMVLMYQVDIP